MSQRTPEWHPLPKGTWEACSEGQLSWGAREHLAKIRKLDEPWARWSRDTVYLTSYERAVWNGSTSDGLAVFDKFERQRA